MNDIIAFIERAMKENLNIRTTHRNWGSFEEYVINIYNSNEDSFVIQYLNEEILNKKNNVIQISKGLLNWVDIEVSEMDIALFKVEILKAEKYSKNKVIEAFNNFFEKDDSKPTTIDDLDNDEE
jgi:hypothetical protein